jgi:hypothetical protein
MTNKIVRLSLIQSNSSSLSSNIGFPFENQSLSNSLLTHLKCKLKQAKVIYGILSIIAIKYIDLLIKNWRKLPIAKLLLSTKYKQSFKILFLP